jgi:hypothetical protein
MTYFNLLRPEKANYERYFRINYSKNKIPFQIMLFRKCKLMLEMVVVGNWCPMPLVFITLLDI